MTRSTGPTSSRVRPPLPEVKDRGTGPRNGIDHFVLARLEQEGLAPSPEADRATLIRRVSLDLTGLPPTLAEVDALPERTRVRTPTKRSSTACWRRRTTASTRPCSWLDLARYADTNGYEKDDRRTIWPYRDWVINAFNRDLPFDQFTIEQIAGDLLPGATPEQKIATGFHRNTMVNTEGGIDDEEFRVAALIDRVNTTMEVWMGTTMGCAQCHNHKYDPFTQRGVLPAVRLLQQHRGPRPQQRADPVSCRRRRRRHGGNGAGATESSAWRQPLVTPQRSTGRRLASSACTNAGCAPRRKRPPSSRPARWS